MPLLSGLSDAVVDGVLTRRVSGRQIPYSPTRFDMELLASADAALASRVPLAVVLPPAAASASVLLGACAVVSAVLHRGKLDVQAALVSSRLADRVLYDELAFGNESLAKLVPRAAVAPDGSPTVIGKSSPSAKGRMYLTSSAERLTPLLSDLESLVLTAGRVTAPDLARLLGTTRAQIPVVYLTGDPNDAALDTVRNAGGIVWAWDRHALAALAELAAPTRSRDAGPLIASTDALRASSHATITIHQPAGGPLDDALDRMWTATAALAAALASDARGPGAEVGARWAWGAFNALALLPVAPAVFDRYTPANPYHLKFSAVPDIAREFARNASASTQDAWAQLADALADGTDAARAQPRSGQVIEWVAARVEADLPATLVVRNAIAAEALHAVLDESPSTPPDWAGVVAVRTLASVNKSGMTMELCVPGIPPRYQVALLALPPATAVTVLACGPRETRRAVRMVVTARARLAELRRETIEVSGPRLGLPVAPMKDSDPVANIEVVHGGQLRPPTVEDLNVSGPDPFEFDLLATLAHAAVDSDEDVSDIRTDRPVGTDMVTVIAVLLAGSKTLFLEPNDVVTRRRGTTLSRVAAKSLAARDRLLLVDRTARTDLRVTLTAKLSERTQFAALRMLVDFWHQRAALAGQIPGCTYQQILDRMTGTSITTTGTISNWIRGVVDGPADHDDLVRFARAIGDDLLLSEAERVSLALRTLHTANRKLGHWLAAQVSRATNRRRDELVDADLGVHVSDLLDAISEHEVLTVEKATREVPAWQVGSLLQSVG